MESTTSSSLSLGARSSLQQQHGSSYPSTPASDTLGGRTAQARPPPSSISTAPSAVPTLQQPSSLAQSFGANPRPSLGVSHSFSRSSSATMDQRYQPYADLSGNHHYSQASSNIPSNSPLALADIRPRGEQSSRDYNDEYPITQTTSAYVAPWPIYGFDWCKWPVSGSSAGKMAICSHLEDPHNFVIYFLQQTTGLFKLTHSSRYRYWTRPSHQVTWDLLGPPQPPSSLQRQPRQPVPTPSPVSCGNRHHHRNRPQTSSPRPATIYASGRSPLQCPRPRPIPSRAAPPRTQNPHQSPSSRP